MFWGCIVNEKKPFDFQELCGGCEILHISNAALTKTSGPGKVYVSINNGRDSFALGSLQKDKQETLSLDIYARASQGIKIMASGLGDVHLTGYFDADSYFCSPNPQDEKHKKLKGKREGAKKQRKDSPKDKGTKKAKTSE